MISLDNPERKEYLQHELAWAVDEDLIGELAERLTYLGTYACRQCAKDTRCSLSADHVPHSFYFTMERFNYETEQYDYWFNGGLIFDSHRRTWSVHT
jgi:hypothetical protein